MSKSCALIVKAAAALYGIQANAIAEIAFLPELTPVLSYPSDLMGLVNWHGQILPVIHLAKRLGFSQEYSINRDSLLVILVSPDDDFKAGVCVDKAEEWLEYSLDVLQPIEGSVDIVPSWHDCVDGVIIYESSMVPLLNSRFLTQHRHEHYSSDTISSSPWVNCLPEVDLHIFRERKDALAQPWAFLEPSSSSQQLIDEMVVFWANQQKWALSLGLVVEFLDYLRGFVPIPSARKPLIGTFNLRGDVVPVLDVSGGGLTSGKAILVKNLEQFFAIPVDDILDIVSPDPVTIQRVKGTLWQAQIVNSSETIPILDIDHALPLISS